MSFLPAAGTSFSRAYTFTDAFDPDGEYRYRLKQIDRDGSISFSHEVNVMVGTLVMTPTLSQNYPNPFNPQTSFEFVVPTTGRTFVGVYNILCHRVAVLFDDVAQRGTRYQMQFDATGIPSGLYFYRLDSGTARLTKRMLLLK